MSQTKNKGGFIGGLLIGGTIGAIVGLLLAPRTGRETRQILKKSADAIPELAEDLSTTVQQQATRLSVSAQRLRDETMFRLTEAIAAGVEASQLEANQYKQSTQMNSEKASTNQNL